jgi:hypothetical protein
MPAAVYVESSVISYLAARPTRDLISSARRMQTAKWWLEHRASFELFVSVLVEEEISGGDAVAAGERLGIIADIPSLGITDEAQQLANKLLSSKAVPANSERDALHIAIAATQGVEFLLTWNFKHINNAQTKPLIARVIESQGYDSPILCSPEELGGNDYDE